MLALTDTPTREKIDALQSVMATMPQVALKTNHYFSDGMYCRELLIPAGVTLVGKVHRKEHFCILSSGSMTIIGEGHRQTFTAPCVFSSKPGAKRAGYAHEDAVFITVHRTAETDLAKLENELVEEDPDSMYLTGNILKEIA